MMNRIATLSAISVFGPAFMLTCGCTSWPYSAPVRTSFVTPAQRAARVTRLAESARSKDPTAVQADVRQLAEMIQTEQDPLVREAIVKAAAKFNTPLAERLVVAAAQDADPNVRITACQSLAAGNSSQHAAALGQIARSDADQDVRLAATRALGSIQSPDAASHLAASLEDADPALQLAAAQSLRQVSGEDLGNDVSAWKQWLASRGISSPSDTAVAEGQSPADLTIPR